MSPPDTSVPLLPALPAMSLRQDCLTVNGVNLEN